MAIESVKQRVSALPDQITAKELRPLLEAIVDSIQAVATKLDLDATVTDTNYAAVVAALVRD
jgi:hypothetical protein